MTSSELRASARGETAAAARRLENETDGWFRNGVETEHLISVTDTFIYIYIYITVSFTLLLPQAWWQHSGSLHGAKTLIARSSTAAPLICDAG